MLQTLLLYELGIWARLFPLRLMTPPHGHWRGNPRMKWAEPTHSRCSPMEAMMRKVGRRPKRTIKKPFRGLPWWCSGWESACQCRGHGFEPWSGKIPHATEQLSLCATTTEPVLWSPWATTTEAREPQLLKSMSHNYWSPWATTTEACSPRARAPQQEKPPRREALAPQQRIAPTRCN